MKEFQPQNSNLSRGVTPQLFCPAGSSTLINARVLSPPALSDDQRIADRRDKGAAEVRRQILDRVARRPDSMTAEEALVDQFGDFVIPPEAEGGRQSTR